MRTSRVNPFTTRATIIADIGGEPVGPDGVNLERVAAFDALFCEAARLYGSSVCDRCDQIHLTTETNNFGNTTLCNSCRDKFDDTIYSLPQWVTDADLPEVLPLLARVYAKNRGQQ